jgi:hypothetical protein
MYIGSDNTYLYFASSPSGRASIEVRDRWRRGATTMRRWVVDISWLLSLIFVRSGLPFSFSLSRILSLTFLCFTVFVVTLLLSPISLPVCLLSSTWFIALFCVTVFSGVGCNTGRSLAVVLLSSNSFSLSSTLYLLASLSLLLPLALVALSGYAILDSSLS